MSELSQSTNFRSFFQANWTNMFNPMAFSLIAYVLYFIINYLGTQIFTTAIYGDLFLAWTWIIIAGSCIMLGVDQSSRIFVSNFLFRKDLDDIKKYMHWGLKFVRVSCTLSVLIAILCFLLFDPTNLNSHPLFRLDYSQWTSFYAFIFLSTPIVGLTNWASSLLIAYKNTSASTFLQFAAIDCILIVIMGMCYAFLPLPLSGFDGRLILLFSFTMVTLIAILMCAYKIKNFFKVCFTHQFNIKPKKGWKEECYKQALNMFIFNAIDNLDIILMGFFEKGNNDVAYYNLSLMIITLIVMIPYSVFQYLTPDINFFLKKANRTAELQSLWNKTMLINGLLTLIVSVITYIYMNQILAIFGSQYHSAKPFLVILLAGNCFSSLIGAPYFILQYGNYVRMFVYINLLCIATMIIMALILVPNVGSVGIAYASITASILQAAASAFIVKRYTNIKPLGFI